MKNKPKTKSRRVTPWTDVRDVTPMQAFIEECTRKEYESKHPTLKDSPEIGLINSFSPEACPHCGSGAFKKKGFTSNGIQRYICLSCGRSFNVLTGTVFDNHKLPLTEWLGFLLDIFGFGSFSLVSKGNRNSINTTKYWKDKVFILLEDSQKDTMLEGTVWIDEKFYTVRSPDIQRKPDGTRYHGLSRNQMCIGVGCDDSGHVLCILEGVGKTSNRRTLEAFSNHIRPGSRLIHDKEKSHASLASLLNLESEIHDSKNLKGVPDKDNPLNKVNQVCNMLQKFLNAHSGFNRSQMQGYLDLFCFIMNPPENKYEKLEKLLNLGIQNPKLLRYRR